MITHNLNKTNLSTLANVVEIEQFLSKEIDHVYNMKDGFVNGEFKISPGDVIFQNNIPCKLFKPFTMVNKNYSFDFKTGILFVTGRDHWERGFRTKKFQLEKVGYKLPTTSKPEGFIYGNPIEL